MNLLDISGMARLMAVVLALAAFGPAPAAAQGDPEYLAEYKAYSAAVDAGDREGAVRHGYAAWQAAEEALGGHELTGILAFNYGQLVIFSDAANALLALERAKELADAGIVELPSADLELFLAYVEFAVNRQRRRQANNLRNALLALEGSDAASTDIGIMWLHLAASDFKNKQYKTAFEAARKSENAFEISSPGNYKQIANAIVIAGAAKLIPFPRELEDVLTANDDFERAIRLFPPQIDVESFDPMLAQALAWHAAVTAELLSRDGGHEEHKDHHKAWGPIFETDIGKPEDCQLEWERRPPPIYPSIAEYRGYIGAVIAVYDFGDDLNIHNAKILSEVPAETFSKTVLRSIEKWRLKSLPAGHPGCHTNYMTHFTFVLPY